MPFSHATFLKQTMVATFAFIESNRNSSKHKHATEFPHAHDTELSHSQSIHVQKVAKISMILHDYPFISQLYWSFTTNRFISGQSLHQLSEHVSKFCKTLRLLRSSGTYHTDTHTDTPTDYYNTPPTLGLIIVLFIIKLTFISIIVILC